MDAETPRSIAIRFSGVTKQFGTVRAVDDLSLEIVDGEFFSMLGPSGSGKTTCLRMIAGFEQPTAGSITLHDKEMAGVPPYERDVNTVFQDYALFPHMTVEDNIGYGLMIRKAPKAERHKRVQEMLELVRLPDVGKRKPSQLSGGQRQRIALARALINHPAVLLLDEPLGALDLKLRQQMQVELKTIQREVGITFIFVTHDQEEALTMSDRIAVFNAGRIEQVGTPNEIYENPATPFVATFVGTSNVYAGEVALRLSGSEQPFAIRPEKLRLALPDDPTPPDSRSAPGIVHDVVYLGMNTRFLIDLDGGGEAIVIAQNIEHGAAVSAVRGSRVRVIWKQDSERRVQHD
ncbi:MAG: ABC transporter ATP-binding protein [Anaerolineae bacterium]|nr:ABC transporter ATP-binding protein [Anaerolineae bacterium]